MLLECRFEIRIDEVDCVEFTSHVEGFFYGLPTTMSIMKYVLPMLLFGCTASESLPLAENSLNGSSNPPDGFFHCPDRPNCVSSIEAREDYQVPPFPILGSPASSLRRLAEIIRQEPRAEIRQLSEVFLYATFTSQLFGFVDDVYFGVNAAGTEIRVKSSSRVGYWDLGVNRRRVELIRSQIGKTVVTY